MFFKHHKLIKSNPNSIYSSHSELLFFITILYSINIKTIAESFTHLDPQERSEIYILLQKYEFLFEGNLGTWHDKPYDIKLKPDAEPYEGKPFLFHAYMKSRSNKNSIDSIILR